MTDSELIRFVDAQEPVHAEVSRELEQGRKRTHWMWFIFPQLEGLGHSQMAQFYGIRDLDEARRYLADPVLGPRLRHHVQLMLGHKHEEPEAILGSIDARKFRSCLTLFREAASEEADHNLFAEALDQFYHGAADPKTLDLLGEVSRR